MKNKIYNYDFLIIGAGLIGCLAALELIRKNYKVLVIDKNVPNKIGGTDRESIDASGLVYVSINSNTKFSNKSAQDMSRYGQIIFDKEKLKRGDLLFFYDTYESKNLISSVGIYLGKNDKNEDEFIISSSSKGVTIADLNDQYYWKDKFFFGTRIFN